MQLLREGVKFINQALIQAFPERTLEAIKGKRKQPAYRRLVADLQEEIANDSDALE